MTPSPLLPVQKRRTYDHRIREQVCRSGARSLGHRLRIPRSTIATWKQRGVRTVVSLDAFGHDQQAMVAVIAKLERRVRILAAAVRLLLALLRASGFRLTAGQLPEGAAKASIPRTIASAEPALSLTAVLKILGLPASRYHAWCRAAQGCGLDDRPSCPRSAPLG